MVKYHRKLVNMLECDCIHSRDVVKMELYRCEQDLLCAGGSIRTNDMWGVMHGAWKRALPVHR